MTDITITAANVKFVTGATIKQGTAGASISRGNVLYRDPADGKHKLADADGASALIRTASAIALNDQDDGQPLTYLTEGNITIGGTLTPGETYYLSDTPGGICPYADLASGDYHCVIGVATSTTVLAVHFQYVDVAA